ncbi:non-homologous end-joining DNA ligase [Calderihabitans maritimus]|uniref:DNA polymerase LigD, polymerase domain protein n=1 Tax=Calderihabitans maritimus TaxID=1246530 RepID=A0A1Z5HXS3_9FIRM|nr:non-homologous end-joining DNA ligase [Calderihabitans maritimus]GAW94333.1 DNA polymerase LigD, polymerase domain protein [Calderihabitans maritimus]
MSRIKGKIGGYILELSNLDKVLWPDEGYTKAHLIEYYQKVSSYLLPHLEGRPLVLKRYPDGIAGKSFYQKECPDYAPRWIKTVPIPSRGKRKVINYCLCSDLQTLLWLANQACIEMHPWLGNYSRPDYPEVAVFDLDPQPPASFPDVLEVALLIRRALDSFNLIGYPKISGASGIHIYIPIEPRYNYAEVRRAIGFLCKLVAEACPEKVTLERNVSRRKGKVYLDYFQNARGKTIASVYSVRPLPGAPVSLPVTWEEIEERKVEVGRYHMKNVFSRLEKLGDLFAPVLTQKQSLEEVLNIAR